MIKATLLSTCGPGSSVGIATGDGMDSPGIESRWGTRFSAPVQTGPGAHPASCTLGTGSFPGVKSGQGVTLTLHPLLVPWPWKGRAIPLLPPWAVRPVQSLSACTRVHFTFFTCRLTRGKEIRYPLYKRLGGPRSQSGWVRTISLLPGFERRTVQPVTSCETVYAILAICFMRSFKIVRTK